MEQSETTPTPEFAGQVSAEHVQFGPGFAGVVSAGQDASVTQAGAMAIVAGGDMDVQYGGATAIVAGGDAEVEYGGAMTMVVGGNMEVENGGAWLAVTRQITAEKSFFGILLTRQANLSEDSRVLLNTPQAVAFGAVFGVVAALVSWLLRKR